MFAEQGLEGTKCVSNMQDEFGWESLEIRRR